MEEIKFRTVLFAEISDERMTYIDEIVNCTQILANLFAHFNPAEYISTNEEFNENIDENFLNIIVVSDETWKLKQRVTFNRQIKRLIDIITKYSLIKYDVVTAKKLIYTYLSTNQEKKALIYRNLLDEVLMPLIEKLFANRSEKTYLLIGSVNEIDRIYMTCTPNLEGEMQEHMYIFRDPILDFIDVMNKHQPPKNLALYMHLYAIREFKPKYITSSPLPIMDELLTSQPFLVKHNCPPPGCPIKNFYMLYNYLYWTIDYDKLNSFLESNPVASAATSPSATAFGGAGTTSGGKSKKRSLRKHHKQVKSKKYSIKRRKL